ncbi:L,D-transpeptidase [Chroococcidiopsis sp. CCNUC1]|uniref:L,D-transpeptidase n=1 Tax=Chroococcidiopsis sp. CCNUC1 TaxID=2653189 RepID=UPI00201FB5B5|nr:L,D-transpeptidase [Chroococcidiopsis sp. CCNUC1]URD49059.1 L,D-transpeptidase [Chroococcidiopsis sp. CCNUC1]
MLKRSLGLLSLLLLSGLLYIPQFLLATEAESQKRKQPEVKNITLINSTTQLNSNTQPTRLRLSLSRRRVTLFQKGLPVKSYPVAIGRKDWETPTGNFRVGQMLKQPTWIHPFTGETVPGGTPENPLGTRWIGFWTDGKNSIGFHGTPNPESVGKAVSHGCVRMYNEAEVVDIYYLNSPFPW